jgi:hypothetical protein
VCTIFADIYINRACSILVLYYYYNKLQSQKIKVNPNLLRLRAVILRKALFLEKVNPKNLTLPGQVNPKKWHLRLFENVDILNISF